MAKKQRLLPFPSTAYKARRIAWAEHYTEADRIVLMVLEASANKKLSLTVPKLHNAVKEILEVEHELTVKLVADYDTKPASLNHKISW